MAYNKKHANFSDAIKKNNRELSKVLPVLQGKIMNFTEASATRSSLSKMHGNWGITIIARPARSHTNFAGVVSMWRRCRTRIMNFTKNGVSRIDSIGRTGS